MVIGLEPTAADVRFVASIEMVEGVPEVTWSPDLGAERVYRVLGAKELGDATARGEPGTSVGAEWDWEVVTEETKGDYGFFKVVVEMP